MQPGENSLGIFTAERNLKPSCRNVKQFITSSSVLISRTLLAIFFNLKPSPLERELHCQL